ncbi:MAG: precorrin-2 C(20)-methyltransferase [Ruminococcus sp.]|nr:precorrin-2 C(20)-methyltransferase [Ruminococcus sp.]
MMSGKLYGVSVGSGDPELITLKAVRIIDRCRIIAVPRTKGEKTLALSIAEKAVDLSNKKIVYIDFPMVRDRKILSENYERIADILCAELEKNDVALLNIGDISIYSTFSYIAERVESKGFETEICSGVPSFCAVSARYGKSLVKESESLHIMPYNAEKIRNDNFSDGTYVIMKCGKNSSELIEILREKGLVEKTYAVENCGLPNERIYNNIGEISQCGYFTVFVVEVGNA